MTREFDRETLDAIERDELWLAQFVSPSPPADTLERIKQGVHASLSCRASRPMSRRWSHGTGAWAAAAMITLAVTTGWYGWQWMPSDTSGLANRESLPMDGESVVVTNRVEDNLSSLETWSKELTWDLTGATMSQALDEVYTDSADNGAVRRSKS